METTEDRAGFFTPFVPFFDPRIGRTSTPMEIYLRLMFLKVPLRLGLREAVPGGERLDHLATVCRIGLHGHAPHPTTLMKLTTRCGPAAVEGLNEALLAKAAEAKLLRTTRVRVDTVVPSNVAYPTAAVHLRGNRRVAGQHPGVIAARAGCPGSSFRGQGRARV